MSSDIFDSQGKIYKSDFIFLPVLAEWKIVFIVLLENPHFFLSPSGK